MEFLREFTSVKQSRPFGNQTSFGCGFGSKNFNDWPRTVAKPVFAKKIEGWTSFQKEQDNQKPWMFEAKMEPNLNSIFGTPGSGFMTPVKKAGKQRTSAGHKRGQSENSGLFSGSTKMFTDSSEMFKTKEQKLASCFEPSKPQGLSQWPFVQSCPQEDSTEEKTSCQERLHCEISMSDLTIVCSGKDCYHEASRYTRDPGDMRKLIGFCSSWCASTWLHLQPSLNNY